MKYFTPMSHDTFVSDILSCFSFSLRFNVRHGAELIQTDLPVTTLKLHFGAMKICKILFLPNRMPRKSSQPAPVPDFLPPINYKIVKLGQVYIYCTIVTIIILLQDTFVQIRPSLIYFTILHNISQSISNKFKGP